MVETAAAPGPSLIYEPASILERLPLAEMFPHPQPLEVELGSGDGSFLAAWAALRPQANHLGVERLLGRLRKLDRKARRIHLSNLRCIRIEAAYFLEYLLPHHSARAIHVYFPDPWPKRKHRKHRLINAHFTEIAQRALEPRGVVFLRTDDTNYFAQMREVFAAAAAFEETPTPEDLAGVVTDFERGFNQKGIATLRAAFRVK
jgi:tRNA (guanine-N7-)-methyltransferase